MATIQQLSEALQNAHAAGDVAAAQQLAQTLQQIQQQQGASPQPQVAPVHFRPSKLIEAKTLTLVLVVLVHY